MIYKSKPTIATVHNYIIKGGNDSIEKYWIPLWLFQDFSPLEQDQINLLKNLLKYPYKELLNLEEKIKVDAKTDEGLDFQYRLVFIAMPERFNIDMDIRTKIWLFMCAYRPGIYTMIFAYIKYRMYQLNITKLDFETFNIRIFQNGFPTENFFEYLWDCQKLPDGSNMLDNRYYYESFLKNK